MSTTLREFRRRASSVALATVFASALLADSVAAQTLVIDPTRAEFSPSVDHDRMDGAVALLDSYELQVFGPGDTQPIYVVNLGKPSPDLDGMIRVDLAGLFSPEPPTDVQFQARVAAKGPGGTSVSDISNPFTFSSGCSFTLSATTLSAPSSGTGGSVTVTAPPGCTWLASSTVPWVPMTSAAEGSGTGSVSFDVAPNAGSSSRSGTLIIAGQTFTVTQAGVPCSYTISPSSASIVAGGGSVSVAVTAGASCAWTATSGTTWLSVSSGSGTGTGNVTVTAAPNSATTTSRTGTVEIAGQAFTVTQAAPSGCTYDVSPASATIPATGGTLTVSVTAPSTCSWTAASQTLWARVTSGFGGYGNGTVTITVGTAITSAQRTGTLMIAGKAFTITQEGVAASCSYAISPASATLPSSGGPLSVAVSTADDCAWSVSSGAAWLTITNGTGTGPGTATFSVAPNTLTTERSATAAVAGRTLAVRQSGTASTTCAYAISPAAAAIDAAGGTLTVTVTTDASCSWTAASQSLWLSVASGISGKGNGTVVVNVKPASTASERTGTMNIAGNAYTVTQAGIPCAYTVTPTAVSLPSNGGTGAFTVRTALGCGWSAAGMPAWVSMSAASRTGSATLGYSVLANPGDSRTATFTVAGVPVTISQGAGAP